MNQQLLLGGSVLTILGAPILATKGFSFSFVENIFVRLALVVLVAYAIRQGPMPGLLTLLAVLTLLIEQNHLLLTSLPYQQAEIPMPKDTSFTIAAPDSVDIETLHYNHPIEDKGLTAFGDKEYEIASDLQDNIPDLPVPPQGEASAKFFESKGLVE
jgi:hypothetical protein